MPDFSYRTSAMRWTWRSLTNRAVGCYLTYYGWSEWLNMGWFTRSWLLLLATYCVAEDLYESLYYCNPAELEAE